MLLGDLGAEVWKIEKPGAGDDTRTWRPPDIAGESCYFLSINRNKRSVAVDLKHASGRSIANKLAQRCDILVENFKPGAMGRLGLDYATLGAQTPSLIYCSITGYGQTGPWSNRGGYDVIAEAVGGLLSITGPRDGDPCKAGVAVVDMLTGLYAHGAIMAALLQRQETGSGQCIDCNLLSTQLATLVNIGSNYLNAAVEGKRWGTAHESIVPYEAFRTRDDRWLVVGAGNDGQFAQLARLVDLPHLADDDDFSTNARRVENRVLLIETLQQRFARKDLADWCSVFELSDLPFGPVNSVAEAFAHPQVVHNGLVQSVEHPRAGSVRLTGPAVRFSDARNAIRTCPPLLGQHTRDVLREQVGLDDAAVDALRDAGVVQCADEPPGTFMD